MVYIENKQQLSEWIREAKKITVLTGAGISTESNIPDFQSLKDFRMFGLPRERLMSLSYFNRNRENFWKAYKNMFKIKLAEKFEPNFGHQFLANLEAQGKEINIFTQNVDGLHQMAGSKNVHEVHGSMRLSHCTHCGEEYDLDYIRKHEIPICKKVRIKENVCNNYVQIWNHPFNYVDCEDCGTRHDVKGITKDAIRCKGKKKREVKCNHILKPDVVLFQEMIRFFQEARTSALQSDLFLVLGSSLEVGPINEIPMFFPLYKKSVLINKDSTRLDDCFNIVIQNSISETFREVERLLFKTEN